MKSECASCIKNIEHKDGNCYGKNSSKPCLLYERDPLGERVWEDIRMVFKLGESLPKPGEKIEVEFGNICKTITVIKINSVSWEVGKKGLEGINIYMSVKYWSDENGKLPPNKPKLKLIK